MSFNELFGLWEAKCNLDILKPLAWFAILKTRKLGLEFSCTSPGIFRECLSFGKVTFSALRYFKGRFDKGEEILPLVLYLDGVARKAKKTFRASWKVRDLG